VEALPELITLSALYSGDLRLETARQNMATTIMAKSTYGKQVKMGAQPNQLAAVPSGCSIFSQTAPRSRP